MQGPFFYPVAQLLMLKPLGVQATSERVVVAVYVVDVDVVVIQYSRNFPSLAESSFFPSSNNGASSSSLLQEGAKDQRGSKCEKYSFISTTLTPDTNI